MSSKKTGERSEERGTDRHVLGACVNYDHGDGLARQSGRVFEDTRQGCHYHVSLQGVLHVAGERVRGATFAGLLLKF